MLVFTSCGVASNNSVLDTFTFPPSDCDNMIIVLFSLFHSGKGSICVCSMPFCCATLIKNWQVGSGQRLDVVFSLIRVGLFHNDMDLVSRNIDKAKVGTLSAG